MAPSSSCSTFQPTHIHGLQGGWKTLVPILFRSLVFANLIEECYQSGVPWQASHKLGELLDLFFARLLPSGTGDFGIGPSQLREKQTNPDVHCVTSITGIIIQWFCFAVNKIMHIKPNEFLLARPWSLFLSYKFIYVKWRYLAILLLYTYTCVCVCVVSC